MADPRDAHFEARPEAQLGPSEFFRAAHGAFIRLLQRRDDAEAMIDGVVGTAFELFESNIAMHAKALPEFACAKNCPACCTLRVTATAPELFLLAHYVRLIDASPAGAQLKLPQRVAEADTATHGLAERQRMTLRRPCPLIFKGVCLVHPVRPLACRGHAAFDRAACAQAAAGRDVEVPVSEPHLHLRGLVQGALQSALRAAGLAWGLHELNHGLNLALQDDQRRAAWTRGEDSLGPVIADFDARAVGAGFDALLASA